MKKLIVITIIFIIILIFLIALNRYNFIKVHELNAICTVVTLIGTLSIALCGWHLEKEKDRESKQRDIRLEYLINAYKQIAMGVKRDPNNDKNLAVQTGLEEAITIIQLYGTRDEIKELHKVLNSNILDFNDILQKLRDRLRKELELEYTDSPIIPLRLQKEYEAINKYQQKQGNS
jgi:hypothetical protein